MNEPSEKRSYETTDVGVRPFVIVAIVLVVAAIVGNLVLFSGYIWFSSWIQSNQQQPGPMARTTQVPPAPQLQVDPRQDMQTMLTEQNQQLNSYGWVDQSAGTAHIPIDRAMDLVLEQGLPARTPGPGQVTSPDLEANVDMESEGGQPPGDTPETETGTEP